MKQVLLLIYFGTYTGSGSEGIYVAEFNTQSGHIANVRLAGKTENPSFLHLHPDGKNLYSVSETNDGLVQSWRIGKDGSLHETSNRKAKGDAPCFVTLSPDLQFAAVANYTSGNVVVFPVMKDGSLGEMVSNVQHKGSSVTPRQKSPHAHSIQFDPTGKNVLSADLGIDELLVYQSDNGQLSPRESGVLDAGSGPRHFAFSKDGKFVFVINELACSITSFAYNDGSLKKLGTITTLPEEKQPGYSTAEILVHPNGQFVYGSNRGHNSIAVFLLDQQTGQLDAVGHVDSGGKTPRNFRISPDGNWLLTANQGSGNIVVHKIDQKTGIPKAIGHQIELSKPVCIKFLSH